MSQNSLYNSPKQLSHSAEFILLCTVLVLICIYTTVRYAGLWGETDTYTRAGDILTVLHTGRLAPAGDGSVYPNGYAYQAVAVFLSNIAGVSIAQIQIYGSALLAVWIVVPTWLAYRELTGSQRGATLACVFLFVQPEFLFVVMRGTHEKFTRGLMLLCLYLLVRSLHRNQRLSTVAGLVLAFYLAIFSIVSFNNLIANSFILALSIALGLCWIVLRFRLSSVPLAAPSISRLASVVVVSLVFVVLVTFYIYPPATYDLVILKTIGQKTVAVALDVEQASTNPYVMVNTGWISRPVYLAVSMANWLLLGASIVIWLVQTFRWLRGKWRPQQHADLLLWALYTAFGLQGALSIITDLSGAVEGTLQHRLFPSFVMLAAPFAARWLVDWRPRNRHVQRYASGALAVSLGVLAVLSIFKATNEPLVSNKWLFYLPAEARALDWVETPLADRYVWTDYDERLVTAIGMRNNLEARQVKLDQFQPWEGTRDFLISDITRARALRFGVPLPLESDSLVTYDNGQTQIYHLRPRTPYQR